MQVDPTSKSGTGLSRRSFLQAGAASGLALALAACGQGSGTTNGSTTIHWLNEEDDPNTVNYTKRAIAEYRKSHNVTVVTDTTPVDQTFEKTVRQLQIGQSYDIAGSDLERYTYLSFGGYLANMQPVVSALGGPAKFVKNTLFKPNGIYDEFPYVINMTTQYIRTDWLDDVNEDVPKTWDDMARVAKKFTRNGHHGIAQPIMMGDVSNTIGSDILWSNRVEFFDSDWNVILDDGDMKDRAVQCLEQLQRLRPYFPPGIVSFDYPDVINAFVNGVVGMAPYAGRLVQTLDENAPDLADKFLAYGYPSPDGSQAPACTHSVNNWVVPKAAAGAAQAMDFIKYMATEKYVGYCLTVPVHFQPTLNYVYSDKTWLNNPMIQKYKDTVDTLHKMADGDGYYVSGLDVMDPGLGKLKYKVSNDLIIPEMYQRVLVKGDSPAAAVAAAADHLRQLA